MHGMHGMLGSFRRDYVIAGQLPRSFRRDYVIVGSFPAASAGIT
jgi:hypothetical protein